jgi:hypothetical protein
MPALVARIILKAKNLLLLVLVSQFIGVGEEAISILQAR